MSNIRYELKLNIFFLYKIEILLYPNLSVYVCEAPSWKLEPRSLPPHTTSTYTCEMTTTPRVCDGSLGNVIKCWDLENLNQ